MGSATSKAVRKLPKEKPTLPTGSRIPAAASAESVHPLPSESKSEAIERDAKDPHFMQKLSQLGPVRVDHPTQTLRAARTSDAVQGMYRSRMRSEAEAASARSTRNRLLASSLTALLDARKAVTDRAALKALATRYDMDVATLERIGRCVNTPSIDERTVVRTRDEHSGEESLRVMARWVDPVPSRG